MIKKLENQLQIEENGSKFATIQEKLTGFRSMMPFDGGGELDDVEV